MIKFEYKPWTPDSDVAELFDPPPVEEITMTLGDDVSWDEATKEFHNFLRGAGYVIPYSFEEDVEEVDELVVESLQNYYAGCSDSGDEDLLWAIDRVLSDYMTPDDYHEWRKEKNT